MIIFKLTFPLLVFPLGHVPDYALVTAMPVVILDDEHKHAARVSADEMKMNSRDETSSNKSAGTSATITSTTRNG